MASHVGVPIELLAEMPALAFERLCELVIVRDKWVCLNVESRSAEKPAAER